MVYLVKVSMPVRCTGDGKQFDTHHRRTAKACKVIALPVTQI